MDLTNKKALVTGGTSGLGLELAKVLLSKGCFVYTYTNNQESILNINSQIQNDKFHLKFGDVSKPEDVKGIFSEIEDLDLLINNAGIWLEGNLEDNSFEDIAKVIDVNLKGVLYNTKLALPYLKKKDISYIVNIVSTSGIESKASQSVYAGTKWGVHGFTECLKTDLRDTGVRVMGVYPGGMKTKIFRNMPHGKDMDKFMDPAEVAKMIINSLETSSDMVIDQVVIKRTKY